LRSFAILLVVFHHWAVKEFVAAGGVRTPVQDHPLFFYGWSGVDLFFILSGFLIGKQLWRELQATGTVAFGRFIMRRGLRIWPIYYVILTYYALFSPIIHPLWPDWTFLSNYVYGGFVLGWSLSTEEQFYLSVPVILLIVRRRLSLMGYLWLLLGIEAVLLLNRHRFITELVESGVDITPPPFRLTTPFHLHLEGLLAGLIIALVSVAKPHLVQASQERGGLSRRGLAVMATAIVAGFTLRSVNGDLFPFVALALVYGGTTYWALSDRSWLSAPLRWPLWYPISRLSYSMYLNHWWVWPESNGYIVRSVQHVVSDATGVFLVSMLIGTLLCVAIAAAMFVLVEHPFLMLRERVLAPKLAAVA
jgi:peptidoglycan/LPS O-acetylase OafA/YrhL